MAEHGTLSRGFSVNTLRQKPGWGAGVIFHRIGLEQPCTPPGAHTKRKLLKTP